MQTYNNILQPGHILKSQNYSYRIERVLGIGGFGITYLATATIKIGNVPVKIDFAIKEHFLTSDCERDIDTSRVVYSNPAKERVESSRKDFISEANRLRKVGIKHDSIVKVNEVFEANNTAYYVMEYLDGESLRKYVKRRRTLSEDEMLAIMTPIVNAVNYLHHNRMTHLDIKPDNIMIVHDNNGHIRPVLIDFGLSKHYDKEGKPTSTINVLGCSDGYAPIEQYAGITTFSPTADIYSLGATMWFCLMGIDPKKSTEVLDGNLSESLPENISKEVRMTIEQATCSSRFDRKIEKVYTHAISNIDDQDEPPPVIYGGPIPFRFLSGISNSTELLNDDHDNPRISKIWNMNIWQAFGVSSILLLITFKILGGYVYSLFGLVLTWIIVVAIFYFITKRYNRIIQYYFYCNILLAILSIILLAFGYNYIILEKLFYY